MLALNGLFILVTKHGLEYPAFYRRLYGLLTLDTFQVCAVTKDDRLCVMRKRSLSVAVVTDNPASLSAQTVPRSSAATGDVAGPHVPPNGRVMVYDMVACDVCTIIGQTSISSVDCVKVQAK